MTAGADEVRRAGGWPADRQHLGWDEYFMTLAAQVARKSKDTTQVGALLVSDSNVVLLTGFNGPPAGVDDRPERFERPEKYLWASHAEANLVAFAARRGIRSEGCSVYVTHPPCASCARTLIQAGIYEVVYGNGQLHMPEAEFVAARVMLREAGCMIRAWMP